MEINIKGDNKNITLFFDDDATWVDIIRDMVYVCKCFGYMIDSNNFFTMMDGEI